jgi:hypothetical protein
LRKRERGDDDEGKSRSERMGTLDSECGHEFEKEKRKNEKGTKVTETGKGRDEKQT